MTKYLCYKCCQPKYSNSDLFSNEKNTLNFVNIYLNHLHGALYLLSFFRSSRRVTIMLKATCDNYVTLLNGTCKLYAISHNTTRINCIILPNTTCKNCATLLDLKHRDLLDNLDMNSFFIQLCFYLTNRFRLHL